MLYEVITVFGLIDTVALDNALEPYLGVRIFMTEPDLGGTIGSGSGSVSSLTGVSNIQISQATHIGPWWSVYFTTSYNFV